MNTKPSTIQSVLMLAIAAAGGTNHALAQSERLALDEIVVTAQRREQSLQHVPISVAVETAATLEKKGITELAGLAVRTPNLFIEDGGATQNIAMRGLGSPGIESIEPSVGLYICLLYTSDAADERSSVDLGGRRIIKKKIKDVTDGSLKIT